jgi:serine/threonine protein kinase/Tol biopolymer transport system component
LTAERWAHITGVFHAALEKPPSERGAFLDEACSGDELLRRDVERLLAPDGEPSLASPLPEFLEPGAMDLASGETLAHYRVEGKIGEGGMGAVYRGYDMRLRRTVALKVLSPERFADLGRKQRLLREARAASGLNHPNIVTIYEISSDQNVDFIAMEYVEGSSLGEMIPPTGLPPRDAVRFAIQISDALAKAHAAGVLHRDLKPSNIRITRDGCVKLLDFGLAKMLEPSQSSQLDALTEEGAVLGTTAYMSPEQADGRSLDARSDQFSFGTVLYEMCTGRRPFTAHSRLALMTKIVNEDAQRPSEIVPLPVDLEPVILRCLRRDAAARYPSMLEVKSALEALDAGAPVVRAKPESRLGLFRRRTAVRNAILLAAGISAAAAITIVRTRRLQRSFDADSPKTVRFTITPANLVKSGMPGEIDAEVSISRDGKHIAYVESAGGQLWVRDLDQEQARPVPGATSVYQVFWSPDNEWIGYSAGVGCAPRGGCDLVKIPVRGGTPATIAKLHGLFRRASWSSDGETIVFCDATGMYTVPSRGGPIARIVEHPHIEHPSFLDLPGRRRAYLYQAFDKEQPVHAIYVQVAGENQRRLIAKSASINPYPAYSPTGHIVYVDGVRDTTAIWALPFSLTTLQPTGKSFPVAQHGASPAISQTGTLVYSDLPSDRHQMVVVDRAGTLLATVGEIQRQNTPTLSPDGRKLVVAVEEGDTDLWVYDLQRGGRTRLTFDPAFERLGAWTPRGDQVTYTSFHNGIFDLISKPSSGSGEGKLMASTPFPQMGPAWSADGKFLMFTAISPETKADLLYRRRDGDGTMGEPSVFLKTGFNEAAAQFSPDGGWVAYVSDESGRNEVYVRDFPGGENKRQISVNGGIGPRWRRDGKEIFYLAKTSLMAARITGRPGFFAATPERLFEKEHMRTAGSGGANMPPPYDVLPDGKRFILLDRPAGEQPLSIHVVHNWFEEFRSQPRK